MELVLSAPRSDLEDSLLQALPLDDDQLLITTLADDDLGKVAGGPFIVNH